MTLVLGIIGTGNIGGGIAGLATGAGIEVVLSNSRGPESLEGLVRQLGPLAAAATPQEAARRGDVVVATIPLGRYRELPADALSGKTVIDTMNYYPERDGVLDGLGGEVTSSGLVQSHLTGAHVVKALNNVDHLRLLSLARPSGAPDRSAVPIAGDDPDAVEAVIALLDRLGFDAVVEGALADGWRSEPGTPVYVRPYLTPHPEGADARRWFLEDPGRAVSSDEVTDLVHAARREGERDGTFRPGFLSG